MQVANSLEELEAQLHSLGWEADLSERNGQYIVQLSRNGRVVERAGKTPEFAMAAAISFASRANHHTLAWSLRKQPETYNPAATQGLEWENGMHNDIPEGVNVHDPNRCPHCGRQKVFTDEYPSDYCVNCQKSYDEPVDPEHQKMYGWHPSQYPDHIPQAWIKGIASKLPYPDRTWYDTGWTKHQKDQNNNQSFLMRTKTSPQMEGWLQSKLPSGSALNKRNNGSFSLGSFLENLSGSGTSYGVTGFAENNPAKQLVLPENVPPPRPPQVFQGSSDLNPRPEWADSHQSFRFNIANATEEEFHEWFDAWQARHMPDAWVGYDTHMTTASWMGKREPSLSVALYDTGYDTVESILDEWGKDHPQEFGFGLYPIPGTLHMNPHHQENSMTPQEFKTLSSAGNEYIWINPHHSVLYPSLQEVKGDPSIPPVKAGDTDPNANWESGEIDPEVPAVQPGSPEDAQKLNAGHVQKMAKAINTEWWKSPDPQVWKQAVMGAFRMALLSPRKLFNWNVVHAQHISHLPTDATAADMFRALEGNRRRWNSARGHGHLDHLRFKGELNELRRIIQEKFPNQYNRDEAEGVALGVVGDLVAQAENALIEHAYNDEKRFDPNTQQWLMSKPTVVTNMSKAYDVVKSQLKLAIEGYHSSQQMSFDVGAPSLKNYQDRKLVEGLGIDPHLDLDSAIKQAALEYHPDNKESYDSDDPHAVGDPKKAPFKYGAFVYDHLDSIEEVGKNIDAITNAAHEDITQKGGSGHYFRNEIVKMNIPGINAKVASFAWLLLAPEHSELGTMDVHMARALTGSHATGTYLPGMGTKEVQPRNYYGMERALKAMRDGMGYHSIPLGQFQWSMWDHARGASSDHRPAAVLPSHRTSHVTMEWPKTESEASSPEWDPEEWMMPGMAARQRAWISYNKEHGGAALGTHPDPLNPVPNPNFDVLDPKGKDRVAKHRRRRNHHAHEWFNHGHEEHEHHVHLVHPSHRGIYYGPWGMWHPVGYDPDNDHDDDSNDTAGDDGGAGSGDGGTTSRVLAGLAPSEQNGRIAALRAYNQNLTYEAFKQILNEQRDQEGWKAFAKMAAITFLSQEWEVDPSILDDEPSFKFVFYKGQLEIQPWHHNLTFKILLDSILKPHGKSIADYNIEDNEIASGDVAVKDGQLDVKLESLADNDVQRQAVEAVQQWSEQTRVVGPIQPYRESSEHWATVYGGGQNLVGLPGVVKVPGHGLTQFGAHPELQALAHDYMRQAGLPYNPPRTYAKVDPSRAQRIAQEYEAMPHNPNDPNVARSYKALANETMAQYNHLVQNGYNFHFYPQGQNPYPNSPREAVMDLHNNRHMYVYPTVDGYGGDEESSDHPLLGDTGIKWGGQPVSYNDLFRAVHDVYGHAKEGVGFRHDGEENAWRQHAAMYSPDARAALTSETRGQNSWVNFGPHGQHNQTASQDSTIYAPQKAGLMPEWTQYDGAYDNDHMAPSKARDPNLWSLADLSDYLNEDGQSKTNHGILNDVRKKDPSFPEETYADPRVRLWNRDDLINWQNNRSAAVGPSSFDRMVYMYHPPTGTLLPGKRGEIHQDIRHREFYNHPELMARAPSRYEDEWWDKTFPDIRKEDARAKAREWAWGHMIFSPDRSQILKHNNPVHTYDINPNYSEKGVWATHQLSPEERARIESEMHKAVRRPEWGGPVAERPEGLQYEKDLDRQRYSKGADTDGSMISLEPDDRDSLHHPDGEPKERLHMTLAYFPSEEKKPDAEALKEITKMFAETHKPFKGHIEGMDEFEGDEDTPHVARVNTPGLEEMQKKLMNILKRDGHKPSEKYPFKPHVTIAYRPKDEEFDHDLTGKPVSFSTIAFHNAGEKHEFPLGVETHESQTKIGDWHMSAPQSEYAIRPSLQSELQELIDAHPRITDKVLRTNLGYAIQNIKQMIQSGGLNPAQQTINQWLPRIRSTEQASEDWAAI